MAGIMAKVALYTFLSTSATAGIVNEVVKKPTATIDVVVEIVNPAAGCLHLEVHDNTGRHYVAHISGLPKYDSGDYVVGEELTFPLDVSGVQFSMVGLYKGELYSPKEYVTRTVDTRQTD